MSGHRLAWKRTERLRAGRQALTLIAQGWTMKAIFEYILTDGIQGDNSGPRTRIEKRSRAWLYEAIREADKTDKNLHNVPSQSDTDCHDAVPHIDSDPLLD